MSESLSKGVAILVGGIFVGAVAAEIIRRKYPQRVATKICAKVRESTSLAKEAFVRGYRNATQSKETAEASA